MSEISLSQEEAANYVKILVNALGSKYVDVYRSEPSVKNGGELKRLDRFQVMGAVWNVIDDDHYACYGNAHGYFRCRVDAPLAVVRPSQNPDLRLSRIRLFTKRIVHIYQLYTLTYIRGLTNG